MNRPDVLLMLSIGIVVWIVGMAMSVLAYLKYRTQTAPRLPSWEVRNWLPFWKTGHWFREKRGYRLYWFGTLLADTLPLTLLVALFVAH